MEKVFIDMSWEKNYNKIILITKNFKITWHINNSNIIYNQSS